MSRLRSRQGRYVCSENGMCSYEEHYAHQNSLVRNESRRNLSPPQTYLDSECVKSHQHGISIKAEVDENKENVLGKLGESGKCFGENRMDTNGIMSPPFVNARNDFGSPLIRNSIDETTPKVSEDITPTGQLKRVFPGSKRIGGNYQLPVPKTETSTIISNESNDHYLHRGDVTGMRFHSTDVTRYNTEIQQTFPVNRSMKDKNKRELPFSSVAESLTFSEQNFLKTEDGLRKNEHKRPRLSMEDTWLSQPNYKSGDHQRPKIVITLPRMKQHDGQEYKPRRAYKMINLKQTTNMCVKTRNTSLSKISYNGSKAQSTPAKTINSKCEALHIKQFQPVSTSTHAMMSQTVPNFTENSTRRSIDAEDRRVVFVVKPSCGNEMLSTAKLGDICVVIPKSTWQKNTIEDVIKSEPNHIPTENTKQSEKTQHRNVETDKNCLWKPNLINLNKSDDNDMEPEIQSHISEQDLDTNVLNPENNTPFRIQNINSYHETKNNSGVIKDHYNASQYCSNDTNINCAPKQATKDPINETNLDYSNHSNTQYRTPNYSNTAEFQKLCDLYLQRQSNDKTVYTNPWFMHNKCSGNTACYYNNLLDSVSQRDNNVESSRHCKTNCATTAFRSDMSIIPQSHQAVNNELHNNETQPTLHPNNPKLMMLLPSSSVLSKSNFSFYDSNTQNKQLPNYTTATRHIDSREPSSQTNESTTFSNEKFCFQNFSKIDGDVDLKLYNEHNIVKARDTNGLKTSLYSEIMLHPICSYTKKNDDNPPLNESTKVHNHHHKDYQQDVLKDSPKDKKENEENVHSFSNKNTANSESQASTAKGVASIQHKEDISTNNANKPETSQLNYFMGWLPLTLTSTERGVQRSPAFFPLPIDQTLQGFTKQSLAGLEADKIKKPEQTILSEAPPEERPMFIPTQRKDTFPSMSSDQYSSLLSNLSYYNKNSMSNLSKKATTQRDVHISKNLPQPPCFSSITNSPTSFKSTKFDVNNNLKPDLKSIDFATPAADLLSDVAKVPLLQFKSTSHHNHRNGGIDNAVSRNAGCAYDADHNPSETPDNIESRKLAEQDKNNINMTLHRASFGHFSSLSRTGSGCFQNVLVTDSFRKQEGGTEDEGKEQERQILNSMIQSNDYKILDFILMSNSHACGKYEEAYSVSSSVEATTIYNPSVSLREVSRPIAATVETTNIYNSPLSFRDGSRPIATPFVLHPSSDKFGIDETILERRKSIRNIYNNHSLTFGEDRGLLSMFKVVHPSPIKSGTSNISETKNNIPNPPLFLQENSRLKEIPVEFLRSPSSGAGNFKSQILNKDGKETDIWRGDNNDAIRFQKSSARKPINGMGDHYSDVVFDKYPGMDYFSASTKPCKEKADSEHSNEKKSSKEELEKDRVFVWEKAFGLYNSTRTGNEQIREIWQTEKDSKSLWKTRLSETINSGTRSYINSPPSSSSSSISPQMSIMFPTNSTSLLKPVNTCPVCQRAFSRPWLLKGHMRTHTGERPFHCSFPSCKRAFADKSNLRSHMQTHTSGTKKFTCRRCGRAFSQKRYLHKHTSEVCKSTNKTVTGRDVDRNS